MSTRKGPYVAVPAQQLCRGSRRTGSQLAMILHPLVKGSIARRAENGGTVHHLYPGQSIVIGEAAGCNACRIDLSAYGSHMVVIAHKHAGVADTALHVVAPAVFRLAENAANGTPRCRYRTAEIAVFDNTIALGVGRFHVLAVILVACNAACTEVTGSSRRYIYIDKTVANLTETHVTGQSANLKACGRTRYFALNINVIDLTPYTARAEITGYNAYM